jgi:hypothetical protein
MLTMSKKDYYKKPADYRSIINGKPYILTIDKSTGATILAPVSFKTVDTFTFYNQGMAAHEVRNARGRCEDAPCCGCCTF